MFINIRDLKSLDNLLFGFWIAKFEMSLMAQFWCKQDEICGRYWWYWSFSSQDFGYFKNNFHLWTQWTSRMSSSESESPYAFQDLYVQPKKRFYYDDTLAIFHSLSRWSIGEVGAELLDVIDYLDTQMPDFLPEILIPRPFTVWFYPWLRTYKPLVANPKNRYLTK